MDEELKNKIIMAQKGDKKILNELVKDNYGLVYTIGRRFENRGYDIEDIYQIGAMGLVKAIKKFDFSFNVVLSTFAVSYIIGEIKRFLRDDGPVKVSRELKNLATKISIEKKENPIIKVSELAKKLSTTKENIILAIELSNKIESLEAKDENDGINLLEKISLGTNNEEKIVNDIAIKQCINKLEAREQKIIYLRYYKGQTQIKVAEILGISQVQVSRIEKKALKFLRNDLKYA